MIVGMNRAFSHKATMVVLAGIILYSHSYPQPRLHQYFYLTNLEALTLLSDLVG